MRISELTPSQILFGTVWPPGGVTITLAKNWNFWLKFFGRNLIWKKMTSNIFWAQFSSKMDLKCSKTWLFYNTCSYQIQFSFYAFSTYFYRKNGKYTRGHFFSETISSKKFQPKFPIFSQSDGDATWWPNSS